MASDTTAHRYISSPDAEAKKSFQRRRWLSYLTGAHVLNYMQKEIKNNKVAVRRKVLNGLPPQPEAFFHQSGSVKCPSGGWMSPSPPGRRGGGLGRGGEVGVVSS